eukprot:Skav218450  [mRNA]  locus=scaffold538:158904:159593:+ [translate_table: standard]
MAPKKQSDEPKAKAGYATPQDEDEEQQPQVATELIEEMLATEDALANLPTSSTTTLEEMLEILRERTKASFSLMKKVDAELKNRGKEAKKELAKAKAKVRALAQKEAKLAKRTGLMTLTINFRNGSVNITIQKGATIGELRKAFITAWNRRGGQQIAKAVAGKMKLFLDTDPLHEHPRRCLYSIDALVDGSVLDLTIDDADATSETAVIDNEEEETDDSKIDEDAIGEM